METTRNRPLTKNPTGKLRPLSEPGDILYHGGCVRDQGPFDTKTEAEMADVARRFTESINAGLQALEDGSSEYAPDVEAMPGAPVEAFDIFDIHTGEHLMIWRVACRHRGSHAS